MIRLESAEWPDFDNPVYQALSIVYQELAVSLDGDACSVTE